MLNCGDCGLTGYITIPYACQLSATNGTPPYTYAIVTGDLPPGLTLDASTGIISGTPTTGGTYNFTAEVTDADDNTADADCSIQVLYATDCSGNVTAIVGDYYTFTVGFGDCVNPPCGISGVSGYIDTTLSLTETHAVGALYVVWEGLLTQAGIFPALAPVTITDEFHSVPVPVCPLTVYLRVTCPPPGNVGVSYSQQIQVAGGTAPYIFTITDGSLPPGLSMNSSGLITGTPTATGSYNFSVSVTDSADPPNTGSATCTLIIGGPPAGPCPPDAQLGVYYANSLIATFGTPPYTYTVLSGNLPPGLTLDSTTGLISGTPTMAGLFDVTYQITDSLGNSIEEVCPFTVNSGGPLLTGICPPTAILGEPYNQAIQPSDGVPPYTFALIGGNLPPGLSLDPSTGVISGTPTTLGTWTFTVRITDSTGATVDLTCSLAVILASSLCPNPTGGAGLTTAEPVVVPPVVPIP